MEINGIIRRVGPTTYLETPSGKYKIHLSERERLEDIYGDINGLTATGQDAKDNQEPKEFPLGWVKIGSLVIG